MIPKVSLRIDGPQLPEIRGAISRWLTGTYQGGDSAVGPDRYGRLSGYTNRKPVHTQGDGRQPWVLVRQACQAPLSRSGSVGRFLCEAGRAARVVPLREAGVAVRERCDRFAARSDRDAGFGLGCVVNRLLSKDVGDNVCGRNHGPVSSGLQKLKLTGRHVLDLVPGCLA